MIEIDKIYVKDFDDKSRLIFEIEIDGIPEEIWFEVEQKYGKYLCYERCDAIVIGLLNWALRTNKDIKSRIPITEELLYNINEYLIPSLVKHDKRLSNINIIAPTEKLAIKNAGGIGTGISCGIDSFHAILNHYKSKYSSMNLTHLCFFSVGSFDIPGYKDFGGQKVEDTMRKKAEQVANLLNIPLISSNSNFIQKEIGYERTHTYSSVFAVYCMQKLWKVYYYGSSGRDFSEFDLFNNAGKSAAKYELLSLPCFSTHELHLYSEGGAKDRMEKTKTIIDNEIVQNFLHVCWRQDSNCGKCPKCKRTLLTIDALGKLDKYCQVFDIDYYKRHKNEYLKWLYRHHRQDDEMIEPIYQALKKNVNFIIRCLYWSRYIANKLLSISIINNKIIVKILFIKISFKIRNLNNEIN